jgi:hypothetical protein
VIDIRVEGKKLIITADLEDGQVSASGKTLVVASTRGNLKTTAIHPQTGREITLGLNAYVSR